VRADGGDVAMVDGKALMIPVKSGSDLQALLIGT
jgi:hypothetical protein